MDMSTVQNSWGTYLAAGLSTLVTLFIIPWLKQHAAAAAAAAKLSNLSSTQSLLEQKKLIIDQMKNYVYIVVSNIAAEKWPA